MRDGDRPSRTTEAFFGRRRGKPVRPQQAAALESGLGAYRLDLTAEAPSDPRTLFKTEVSAVR
ncbi:tRNA (guanosine(46)-N7)-methyltransferase TrmB, partial [Mesorhizobium sp. M00.F.Ca.ET.158.01.1.1]